MDKPVKILVVEDEIIIGAKISMQLTSLGYEVTGILPRGEEVLDHVKVDRPDIIIMDVQLKGKMDGIETATLVEQHYQIPIIYLTANADSATFNRAKPTKPYAFLSKPYQQLDLQRAIELALSHMEQNGHIVDPENNGHENRPFVLNDRIFIRSKDKMTKIFIDDILYIEADRNYSRIFTKEKEFLLSITLKTIEEKLSDRIFLRTHRSYLINLSRVDEVADGHVIIDHKAVPMSAGLKEQLLQRIQTL